MTARAGVSESAFYDFFRSVEDCYRAAYDEGLDRLSRVIAEAVGREQGWLEPVRAGLVALLGFFDDDPGWARLVVLEVPLEATVGLDCRRQLYDVLARLLDCDCDRGGSVAVDSPMLLPALTGELVVGGVFSVIRTNMLENDGSKLVELAPSLMTFIAVQYGYPETTGELAPPSERIRAQSITRTTELPIRATHRTTLVLHAIAQTPYSNNREIAEAAGVSDEGQISKLLARLERQAVIENVGVGPARGEPNAWLLTSSGRRALALIGEHPLAPRARRTRVRGQA